MEDRKMEDRKMEDRKMEARWKTARWKTASKMEDRKGLPYPTRIEPFCEGSQRIG